MAEASSDSELAAPILNSNSEESQQSSTPQIPRRSIVVESAPDQEMEDTFCAEVVPSPNSVVVGSLSPDQDIEVPSEEVVSSPNLELKSSPDLEMEDVIIVDDETSPNLDGRSSPEWEMEDVIIQGDVTSPNLDVRSSPEWEMEDVLIAGDVTSPNLDESTSPEQTTENISSDGDVTSLSFDGSMSPDRQRGDMNCEGFRSSPYFGYDDSSSSGEDSDYLTSPSSEDDGSTTSDREVEDETSDGDVPSPYLDVTGNTSPEVVIEDVAIEGDGTSPNLEEESEFSSASNKPQMNIKYQSVKHLLDEVSTERDSNTSNVGSTMEKVATGSDTSSSDFEGTTARKMEEMSIESGIVPLNFDEDIELESAPKKPRMSIANEPLEREMEALFMGIPPNLDVAGSPSTPDPEMDDIFSAGDLASPNLEGLRAPPNSPEYLHLLSECREPPTTPEIHVPTPDQRVRPITPETHLPSPDRGPWSDYQLGAERYKRSGLRILKRLSLVDPISRMQQWANHWGPYEPLHEPLEPFFEPVQEEPMHEDLYEPPKFDLTKMGIPNNLSPLKRVPSGMGESSNPVRRGLKRHFTLAPTSTHYQRILPNPTIKEHRLDPGMPNYPIRTQIGRPSFIYGTTPAVKRPYNNNPGTSQDSMSNDVALPGSNTEEDSNDESPQKLKIVDNKSKAGERTPHGSWVVMGLSTSKKSKSNAKEIPLKATSPIKIRIIPLPGFSWADSTELSLLMCFKEDVGINDRDPDVFRKHPNLTPRMRAILLDWLMEVCEVYKMRRTTYYLAVDYIDRYLSRIDVLPKHQLQLLGITCLFIASKVEEIYPPKLLELAYVTDGACTDQEMLLKEMAILKELRWDVLPQTVSSWLYLFLQMACSRNKARDTFKREYVDNDFIYPQMSTYAFMRASQLIDLCTLDDGMLQFQYSVIAAAAIYYLSNRETALYVSGLTWVKIKDCVRWMGPFAEIIRRKCLNTPFPTPKEFTRVGSGLRRENPRIILDESHTLQTHAVDLAMLEEVYSLVKDDNYQNVPYPGFDQASNIDPIIKQDDDGIPETQFTNRRQHPEDTNTITDSTSSADVTSHKRTSIKNKRAKTEFRKKVRDTSDNSSDSTGTDVSQQSQQEYGYGKSISSSKLPYSPIFLLERDPLSPGLLNEELYDTVRSHTDGESSSAHRNGLSRNERLPAAIPDIITLSPGSNLNIAEIGKQEIGTSRAEQQSENVDVIMLSSDISLLSDSDATQILASYNKPPSNEECPPEINYRIRMSDSDWYLHQIPEEEICTSRDDTLRDQTDIEEVIEQQSVNEEPSDIHVPTDVEDGRKLPIQKIQLVEPEHISSTPKTGLDLPVGTSFDDTLLEQSINEDIRVPENEDARNINPPAEPDFICSIPRTGLASFLPEVDDNDNRRIGVYRAGALLQHEDDDTEMDPN